MAERLILHTEFSGDCWLWKSTCTNSGHGTISLFIDGVKHTAFVHRVSWELFRGPIPEGSLVLHRKECTSPRCWRPSHLYLGDHAKNARDRNEWGRRVSGEAHGMARLTSTSVEEMRQLHAAGWGGYDKLGKRFGVTKENVRSIIKGWTWKPITES